MATPREHRAAPASATLVAALLCSVTACGFTGGDPTGVSPAAACAGPEVAVSVAEAGPGDIVTVVATNLSSDCYDTGQVGTPPPRTDVDVAFENDGRTSVLATLDADPTGTIMVDVMVPMDAAPGEASFTVGTSDPARLVITARAP